MFAFDHEVTLRADSAPDFKFSLRARLSICLRIPVSYENILNAHAGFIPGGTVLMKGTTEDLSGVHAGFIPGRTVLMKGTTEDISGVHAGFIPARTVLMKGTTEDISGVSRRIHPGQNRVDEGGY
ncbi:hypothetical protein DMN77_13280 [Paenibacillus sp. 79R4]|uniref:hypothetical protein n=1 Tax=Paenibacillus sp. 79R4 TaxID=2212847 RepID=UPI0015B8CDB9|nr:hypothetical protein [Paenibacillus sp. 79R4]NWL88542.1 hypothetical protein [Paenibacillus sp. 79R4]